MIERQIGQVTRNVDDKVLIKTHIKTSLKDGMTKRLKDKWKLPRKIVLFET